MELRKSDVGSKSDPIGVVYMRRSLAEEWEEIGRTEWIKNNQNPSFLTAVRVQYNFEFTQYLRFVIYDVDDEKAKLKNADHLGATETTLASILSCPSGTFTQPLQYLMNAKVKAGSISVVAQEVRESNNEVRFNLYGHNLDKKDVFGKSDPYIVINQKVNGILVPVHQTETIMNTLEPVWKPFTLNLQKLCGSDMDRPVIFECFDWDKHGQHDLIGSTETTVGHLAQLATEFSPVQLPLINPKKAGKRGYKNSGTLVFKGFTVAAIPTFLDYIRGGCELNMVVAIDFTASNGLPGNKFSLHHVEAGNPNQYEMAITVVGSTLAFYDRDGMIPVYGFGGSLPGGKVSHCFPLNGNPSNPEVPGIQGVFNIYHQALSTYGLSGPTYFSEIIHETRMIIQRQDPSQQKYFVLLILTDGSIDDMDKTADEIVKAANELPLSIVIVGVGHSSDLKKMEILDSDDHALKSSDGKKAKRDIVQFVPFSKYASCPRKLAEETLAEIPHQLVSYMRGHGIHPVPVPVPTFAAPAYPMAAPGAPAYPMAAAGAPPAAAAGYPPQ